MHCGFDWYARTTNVDKVDIKCTICPSRGSRFVLGALALETSKSKQCTVFFTKKESMKKFSGSMNKHWLTLIVNMVVILMQSNLDVIKRGPLSKINYIIRLPTT